MQLFPWQKAIYERMRDALPNRVFIDAVPEPADLAKDFEGKIKPFAILWFGTLMDGGTGFDAFCGPENSAYYAVFQVSLVGPPSLGFLEFEDFVRGILTGFSPAGGGGLREWGSPLPKDSTQVSLGADLRAYRLLTFRGIVS